MDEGTRPAFFRRSVQRHWTLIVAALLLGISASSALVWTSTEEYKSTSVIFLDPLVGNPYSPTTPSGRQEQLAALTTEAGLVLADTVARNAEAAARETGIDLGPRIQERTSTEVPSNSQVINVSFTATSPATAQAGAQALATSYLEYRQSRSEAVVEAQLARIDQEISSLTALVDTAAEALNQAATDDAETSAAEIQNLEEQVRIYANQLGQLRIERVTVQGAAASPGEIVSPAQVPVQPEGIPAPVLAVAITLIMLGSGVLAAVVLEHLNTRLHSTDEIERLGLRPAFGVAPEWRPELRGTDSEDAYRLATLSWRGGVHAVAAADGYVPEGVVAGLAHTLVEMGHSVVVVLAAGERDTGRHFGLSDVLADDEIVDVSQLHEARPGLRVLGAGRHWEDLPSLVHGARFLSTIETLAQRCDVLLIIGSEARSAAGAALSDVSDTTLLVCFAGQTREVDLLASVKAIQESDGTLRGVLLADRPSKVRRRRAGTAAGLSRAGVVSLLTGDPEAARTTHASKPVAHPHHHLIPDS